jgi:hypothetical protein
VWRTLAIPCDLTLQTNGDVGTSERLRCVDVENSSSLFRFLAGTAV